MVEKLTLAQKAFDELEEMIVNTIENTSEVFKQDFTMLKDTKVDSSHVKKLIDIVPTNVMDGFVQYLCAHKPHTYWDLFNVGTNVLTHNMNRNTESTHNIESSLYKTVKKWAVASA